MNFLAAILFAAIAIDGAEIPELPLARIRDQARIGAIADNTRCQTVGVVTHVSGYRTRLFVMTRPDRPWEGGMVARLPPGGIFPQVGDEIAVEGFLKNTPIGIELSGAHWTKLRTRDLDRALTVARRIDLRDRRLDMRRVSYSGKVTDITVESEDTIREHSVLQFMDGSQQVLVAVPGKVRKIRYLNHNVRVVGCVFPVVDEHGSRLGTWIELGGLADIELLEWSWRETLIWAGGGVAVALIVFVLVLFIRSQRARLRMEAVVAERRRMGRDIHDTLEQYLAGARMVVMGMFNSGNLSEQDRKTLGYVAEVLARAKSEAHDAVQDLWHDYGPNPAPGVELTKFAREFNAGGEIRIRTAFVNPPAAMPANRFRDLLAIVREAVANAIKHGKCRNIAIVGDGSVFRVLNDGEHFDITSASSTESGHFGLASMRERARKSGFKLAFAMPGRWTGIEIGI